MIGRIISHYKILEKLGEGGMGVVYKAEDTALGRTVALKFLPKLLTLDEEATARFLQEAKAASSLDHPNIATIYELGQAEGENFISMAYLDGVSLRETIGEKPLSVGEILSIGRQIAEGLGATHSKDIIHRDIKPENIMVTKNGVVKIMDFGLAKLRGARQVTQAGTTLGTVSYMSPEQVQGREVDQRSDIFSFGAVLHELVTGQRPFAGDHEAAIMYSIVNEEPKPPGELRSGIPLELEEIIRTALQKEPAHRYQRMEEVLRDIRTLEEKLKPQSAPKRIPGRRRRNAFIAAVGVAVIAVFFFFGLRIQVRRQPPAEATTNSLAIMYFDNLADPSDSMRVGETITNLLITDLSESRYVQVVSSQRLYDILKLLGREGARRIDRNVATEVARKANAKWMLTGTIIQGARQIVVTGHIIDVATGNEVNSQKIAGAPNEDIFALVDRLTAEVKKDLFLPVAAQSEPDPPIADVTTRSQEAYRAYLEGCASMNKLYWDEALSSFQKAVEYDSTFVMAYVNLLIILTKSPRAEYEGMERELVSKALRHSNRASWKEKNNLFSVAASMDGDYRRAIEELEKIIERDPHDKAAYLWIGILYGQNLNEPRKAIEHFTKAIEIDSLAKMPYNMLAYEYDKIGDFEKSLWAIDKYLSLAPDEPNPYDTRGDLYAYNGKLDQAIDSYGRALAIKPDFTGTRAKLGCMYLFKREYGKAERCFNELLSDSRKETRSRARMYLALVPLYQGRFKEALQMLDEGLAADRIEKYEGDYAIEKHDLKTLIHMEQNNAAMAGRENAISQELVARTDPGDCIAFRDSEAWLLAKDGETVEARKVLESLKKDIAKRDPTLMPYWWQTRGIVEVLSGDAKSALECFEESLGDTTSPLFEAHYYRGIAFLEAGDPGQTVQELEQGLLRYDSQRAYYAIQAVKAYYVLGQAYEKSGWKSKAVESYRTFLEIWKNADPGIPEANDARERLARLQAGI